MIPRGELDGVAADTGEAVDDEGVLGGAGRVEGCDWLGGDGEPALVVQLDAGVVSGKEGIALAIVFGNERADAGGNGGWVLVAVFARVL